MAGLTLIRRAAVNPAMQRLPDWPVGTRRTCRLRNRFRHPVLLGEPAVTGLQFGAHLGSIVGPAGELFGFGQEHLADGLVTAAFTEVISTRSLTR